MVTAQPVLMRLRRSPAEDEDADQSGHDGLGDHRDDGPGPRGDRGRREGEDSDPSGGGQVVPQHGQGEPANS